MTGETKFPFTTPRNQPLNMQTKHDILNKGLIILFFVLVFMTTLYKVQDFDTWMHLRSGEEILKQKTIFKEDIFSHTAKGKKWINHQWLSQVIFYLCYHLGGIPCLIIFKALLSLVAFIFLWQILSAEVDNPKVVMVALTCALFTGRSRFTTRPEVFTLVFSIIVLYLVTQFIRNGNWKRFWPLVPIFILWINTHAGYVSGFIILGAGLIQQGISAYWPRIKPLSMTTTPRDGRATTLTPLNVGVLIGERSLESPQLYNAQTEQRKFFQLASVIGVCLVLTLFNPSGLTGALYPVFLLRENLFMKQIMEWMPPEFNFTFSFFWIYLGMTTIILLTWIRRLAPFHLIIFSVYAMMAFGSRRHISLFAITNALLLTLGFQWFHDWLKKNHPRFIPLTVRRHPWFVSHLTPSVITGSLGVILVATVILYTPHYEFGLTVRDRVFPKKAAEFIHTCGFKGNLCNPYEWGGYLLFRLYPEQKVFMDGRCLVYGPKIVKEYESIMLGRLEVGELLDKWKVDMVITDFSTKADPVRGLQDFLAVKDEWRLIYYDDLALVYLRNDHRFQELLNEYAYQIIDPNQQKVDYLFQLGKIEEGIADLKENLQRHPDNHKSSNILAIVLGSAGRVDEAIAQLKRSLEMKPDSVDAYYNLGYYYSETGLAAEAEQYYRQALKLDPTNTKAMNNLGNLYLKVGRYYEALRLFRKSIKIDETFEAAYVNLASCYANLGKLDSAIEVYHDLLAVEPKSTVALNNLGNISAERQDFAMAKYYWEAALLADPSFSPARENLAKLQYLSQINQQQQSKM